MSFLASFYETKGFIVLDMRYIFNSSLKCRHDITIGRYYKNMIVSYGFTIGSLTHEEFSSFDILVQLNFQN